MRRGQHHCTICTSDSVPSDGARWWSWSRRLESTGRAGLLGWAGPRRVYRQPQPPRPGGEKTQVQTSGWRAAAARRPAESSALSQMLYAVLATRRPSSTHQPSTPATHSIVSVNCWTTSTTTPSTPPPRPCSCGAETLGAGSCPAPARGAALVTETGSGAVSDW